MNPLADVFLPRHRNTRSHTLAGSFSTESVEPFSELISPESPLVQVFVPVSYVNTYFPVMYDETYCSPPMATLLYREPNSNSRNNFYMADPWRLNSVLNPLDNCFSLDRTNSDNEVLPNLILNPFAVSSSPQSSSILENINNTEPKVDEPISSAISLETIVNKLDLLAPCFEPFSVTRNENSTLEKKYT